MAAEPDNPATGTNAYEAAAEPDNPALDDQQAARVARGTNAYEAVRAHELMLNEAVSRFEHASLAPLIVLNGGAAVAFLTLVGALLGKESGLHPDTLLSCLAAAAWVLGLVAAAFATTAAAGHQSAISAAHRLLREGLEDELMEENIAEVLRGPKPVASFPRAPVLPRHPIKRTRALTSSLAMSIQDWWEESRGAPGFKYANWPHEVSRRKAQRRNRRAELRAAGGGHARRFKTTWGLSVAMFVTGATLAGAAIMFPDPPDKSQPTKEATGSAPSAKPKPPGSASGTAGSRSGKP